MDSRALNGTWLITAARLGGVRLPADAFEALTLTFSNDWVQLGPDCGVIKLDRTAAPNALDLLFVGGPNSGRFVPAIVECEGGVLRICCDLAGAHRPAEFRAAEGTRFFSAVYRRAASHARRPASVVA
jgi:uncharacterized protein (TIGR03067 family)